MYVYIYVCTFHVWGMPTQSAKNSSISAWILVGICMPLVDFLKVSPVGLLYSKFGRDLKSCKGSLLPFFFPKKWKQAAFCRQKSWKKSK